jgi:hypothetical protein
MPTEILWYLFIQNRGSLILSKTLCRLHSHGHSVLNTRTTPELAEHVFSEMNDRLLAQSNKIVNNELNEFDSFDISKFNPDKFIAIVDPALWKLVVLLTKSSREKLNHISHLRQLQGIYSFCVLLFCNVHYLYMCY